jgi:hypothetical protein
MSKKTVIPAFICAAAFLANAAAWAGPTFVNGLAIDGSLIDATVRPALITAALASSRTFTTTRTGISGGACPTGGRAVESLPTTPACNALL